VAAREVFVPRTVGGGIADLLSYDGLAQTTSLHGSTGTRMLLRIAAGIVCFMALAPCQGGEEEAAGERSQDARNKLKEQMRAEKGEKPDGEENLTPEQRLARNVTHGASAYCRFLASMKPAKLLPGQSGTLKIVATLQGHAVLPAPSQLEMTPAPSQGPISIGAMTIKPAETGRLEKGYLGRPVYENYAELEVPVTMAANAELGKKHLVAVDMKFDLYDGNSAQVIGRFVDRVATEVKVGSVPDPAVAMRPRSTPGAGKVDKPAEPSPKETQPANSTPALQGNVIAPAPVAPATEPAPVTPEGQSVPQPAVEDGGTLPMGAFVGIGVVLLVLVLLLARKK
jgi:hypothetical protein